MQAHQPVLTNTMLEVLDPQPGESYLDLTAGYGGHASAVMGRIGDEGRVALVDRDSQAAQYLRKQFGQRAETWKQDFAGAAEEMAEGGSMFDLILLDLGVSSAQLDSSDRGFSFKSSGPLDMRMDQGQALTAAEVVNEYREEQLANVIYRYGEERYSRRVARAIVAARPLNSTAQLAAVIRRVVPASGHIDPATRTFQAIRIEVNGELDQLERTLPLLPKLLVPGGRLAIISFHSLEDRLVKQFLDRESRDCICPPEQPVCTCNHHASLRILTKKPLSGEPQDANNLRARSAKLRAAVKINNQNQKEKKA